MSLSPSARKVQAALAARGFTLQVVELPQSTRTSAEAAAAVGCTVGQIAKSIVFRAARSQRPVLVLTSGVNRVSESAVAVLVGEPLAKADADFVRARTGFAIGGIPPFGHATPIRTLMDPDLGRFEVVWAAAGTANAVFAVGPQTLRVLANATVTPVSVVRGSGTDHQAASATSA